MTKQELKSTIIEHWLLFRVFCGLKIDALRLDFAIFMADALQRAKNKRFYVIENAQGKLIWLCNEDIRAMKKPRRVRRLVNGKLRTYKITMLPKNFDHLTLMKDCLYYTPISRQNSIGISVEERNCKRKKWLEYLERIRTNRLLGKLKAENK